MISSQRPVSKVTIIPHGVRPQFEPGSWPLPQGRAVARYPLKIGNLEVLVEVEDPSLNLLENTIRKKINMFTFALKREGGGGRQ